MAGYAFLEVFMHKLKTCNPQIGRLRASEMAPIIRLLQHHKVSLKSLELELRRISPEKMAKYQSAIWYLQSTYPGLNNTTLTIPKEAGSMVAVYKKKSLPSNYDPSAFPPIRNQPENTLLDITAEQWLLERAGKNVGILMIHLSSYEPPMDHMISGRKVVDHLNSVLEVGSNTGASLLCLHMEASRSVCEELETAAAKFGGRRCNLLIADQHMGGGSAIYRKFATAHKYVLVMGFDANICVNANLFGSPERYKSGQFIPPLTSLTNVVSSRAMLVTDGAIFPVNNQGEYGVLNGA